MKKARLISLLWLVAGCGVSLADGAGWPAMGAEQKPWTRWWWLGSGVDEKNLTKELEAFAKAGLGGVEICPIYGAVGYEERDRDFLTKEWMEALAHTTKEAKRLGLGVDMTTGTGWPFGGPWVEPENASNGLVRIRKDVAGGAKVREKAAGEVIAVMAYPDDGGKPVDLKGAIREGVLEWKAPAGGGWKVMGLLARSPVQKVKRAAPGGAGNVLDPYSSGAMKRYLARFDEAFKGFGAPEPRAQFHDSFEYYEAEWTPGLLERFRKEHGYDLTDELPAFLGAGDAEVAGRVRADWRDTLSGMHRDYLATWHSWANGRGGLTRNQAHGSPGNLLDHYAVADIPETEIFRQVEESQIPMMGLAAAAAHVNGRKLVSAESFTWLGEHYQVTPAELKRAADFLYLSGVNHLFYHGIPYSPEDAPWPGWLFYASTHMGPKGGLWRELPVFNGYLGRIQSVLQGGRPDSEVMLYFPFDDLPPVSGGKLSLFSIHSQKEWLHRTGFHRAAMELWNAGIPYDAVSGDMLARAEVDGGVIRLGDVRAKVLVVPGVKLLPVEVMRRMLELAEAGVTVLFEGGMPADVPGYGRLEERRAEMKELLGRPRGAGVVVDGGLMKVLAGRGIEAEPMCANGIRLVRRVREDGWDYFLVNRSGKRMDGRVRPVREFESAVLLDPADGTRHGLADVNGEGIRLVLDAGESLVVRLYRGAVSGQAYPYRVPVGTGEELVGKWKVEFTEGGPDLPKGFETERLKSWTERDDPALKAFSGTARYSLAFDAKPDDAEGLMLDLGVVGETCRVRMNGRDLGGSFFPPHRFDVTGIVKDGANEIEVEVVNLSANRIADLDRRGVEWKRFHEINFVNVDYKSFDASGWKPLRSGLIGPVRLVPVR